MNPNPIEVIQDIKYPSMYRLKWEDGVLSEDFYNLSRANDILRNYDDYVRRMEMLGNTRARHRKNSPVLERGQGLDALKPQQGTHIA